MQLGVAADLATECAADVEGDSERRRAPRVEAPPTRLGLDRVCPEMALSQLRSATVGRLVSVRATVTRVGAIRPLVRSACFSCAKCGAGADDDSLRARFEDGKYDPPSRCSGDSCKARRFDLIRETARTVDFQKIRIQQQFDDAPAEDAAAAKANANDDAGRVPRSLDVEMVGASLVDRCVPGDIVVVSGIVKSIQSDVASGRHDKRALSRSVFVLYLEAVSVVNLTRTQDADADCGADGGADRPSSRELARMQAIAADEDPVALVVASLCPSIYGHELVKLSLLLGLFGGSSRDDASFEAKSLEHAATAHQHDGRSAAPSRAARGEAAVAAPASTRDHVSVRSSSHVLIVGDPGLGKSQMLRAAAAVAPRAVYVCGNTTTATGLTVSVSRDGGERGASALEAGALVLADRGACLIDEFDKMDPGQHAGLLEAMEQQQISIAKAGVVASLSARAAVLAAANPVGGQYDRSKTVSENLKLSQPLLSRFDLVFILVDDADDSHDTLLSRHVIRMHSSRSTNHEAAQRRDGGRGGEGADGDGEGQGAGATQDRGLSAVRCPLEARLRRGGANCGEPVPRGLLRKYVAHARRTCRPQLSTEAARLLQETYLEMRRAAAAAPRAAMPITMRQLESLVRLAQARAKLELRHVVTAQDARDVVELLKASVADACKTATGAPDYSRAASGMSAAKHLRALVEALHVEADRKRDPWFSIHDVEHTAISARLTSNRNTRDVLDMLREQNYLLYQPHLNKEAPYRLASSKYASQTATQASTRTQASNRTQATNR
ncbi:MCM2/3/5 family-domain-containing protein [Pelagophyceae sp. CCMP2097]|nr:MCM2/3/5 family-domain-containing protein [Pelagophyceae sp. CCMP2097]